MMLKVVYKNNEERDKMKRIKTEIYSAKHVNLTICIITHE